jgi:hypothetical protein
VVPTLPTLPSPVGGFVPPPPTAADDAWLAGVDAAIPSGTARTPLPSVARVHLGPSRTQRRLRGRAHAASVAIILSTAVAVVGALALLQRRAALIDLRAGAGPSDERFAELDDRAVLLSLIDLGVRTLAGIVVVVWFWRAYKNLRSMGRASRGTGWALACWVVPIMNLFRPYQMMKELVRESPRVRGNEGAAATGLWWMLYVVAILGGRAIWFLPEDTLDEIIRNDLLRTVFVGAWVLAGVALLVNIRVVTRHQDAWFDPLPDDPVPVTELR